LITEKLSMHIGRDGFRERGALGHFSFWGSTQMWPIWSLVFKAWKYVPLTCNAPWNFCLLWCGLWFYDCLWSVVLKPWPVKQFSLERKL